MLNRQKMFEEIKEEVMVEFSSELEFCKRIESLSFNTLYPDQLREIQDEIVKLIAKIRMLNAAYEGVDSLPLKAHDTDFDCLNRSLDLVYEEVLKLIDTRHFVKKVFSDGHTVQSFVNVDSN